MSKEAAMTQESKTTSDLFTLYAMGALTFQRQTPLFCNRQVSDCGCHALLTADFDFRSIPSWSKMVKITIKAPRPEEVRSESESEEDEGESSEEEEEEEEEVVEPVIVSSSRSSKKKNEQQTESRSKRKCVLKLERKKERKRAAAAASRSKSATPEERKQVVVRQPKKMFTCQACSKAFHSNFVLKVHLRAHKKIEENPEKCDRYYLYYYHTVN